MDGLTMCTSNEILGTDLSTYGIVAASIGISLIVSGAIFDNIIMLGAGAIIAVIGAIWVIQDSN